MWILEGMERKKHGRRNPSKPKARASGEGSVFAVTKPLKDGTERTYYRAAKSFTLPDGSKSKPVVKQGSTPAEAIEKRDNAILKLKVAYGLEPLESLPPDPKLAYLTVGDCLMDWMDERRKENLAAATIHMYDARIRNHLLPVFGGDPVRLLTYAELKVFFNDTLPDKGLGTDSIRQTFICLKSSLDHYLRDGKIALHPMVGLKAPAKKKKTPKEITDVRQASHYLGKYLIIEARKVDQEARWFLGMLGMRQGEVLGMTDDCLVGDSPKAKGRRVKIKQQLQRVGYEHGCKVDQITGKQSCGLLSPKCPQRKGMSGWALQDTKTESGAREIVVDEESWKMLVAHRKKQQELRKLPTFRPEPGKGLDKLLFTRDGGKPVNAQRDREDLEELILSIKNLPEGITVHTLRHVATTAMVHNGADRINLASMMGWSPKNADAQIATYSSADNALRAANTSMDYIASFYKPKE